MQLCIKDGAEDDRCSENFIQKKSSFYILAFALQIAYAYYCFWPDIDTADDYWINGVS